MAWTVLCVPCSLDGETRTLDDLHRRLPARDTAKCQDRVWEEPASGCVGAIAPEIVLLVVYPFIRMRTARGKSW